MSAEIDILLAALDQAFDHRSWHGPNLRGSIAELSAAEAAWRSAPERHSAWEIAVHAAFWKYVALRQLAGESAGAFALPGFDWFPRPEGEATAAAWQADLRLLDETHRTLREAVARLTPEEFHVMPPGGEVDNLMLITGITAHDVYHAGQIQLLGRLHAAAQAS